MVHSIGTPVQFQGGLKPALRAGVLALSLLPSFCAFSIEKPDRYPRGHYPRYPYPTYPAPFPRQTVPCPTPWDPWQMCVVNNDTFQKGEKQTELALGKPEESPKAAKEG